MGLIPIQLEGERFLKLQFSNPSNEKAAAEKDWPESANYSYETFQTFGHPTYGVLCGNGLIVIDCDTKEGEEALNKIPQFQNTFTVQSAGKGLSHFYFHVEDDFQGFRLDNNSGQRVFDVQGARTYVVGPLSQKLDGSIYKIKNDAQIASISFQELSQLVSTCIPNLKVTQKAKKVKTEQEVIDFDEVCVEIKKKIKPIDLLPKEHRTPVGVNTICPLGHVSEGGKCFSHDDELWHCFHCEESGNVIQLYQKMNTCTFQEAKRDLAMMAGLDDKFKNKVLRFYSSQDTKHLASELMAKEILKYNKIVSIRTDRESEMWIYRHGIYTPNARTYIHEFTRNILGQLYTTTFANKIVDKIEVDTYREQELFFINEDLDKVPVLNGILDLKTTKLEPFSDKYTFFNKIPIFYDPLQKPKLTLEFIKDIVKDEDNVNLIQELFGYLLHREYNIEKTFMFIGSGRNGKGKLLGLIREFIGSQNCLSLSLQEITKPNSYDTEKLFGKYVNLGGDIPKTKIGDTSKLKSFTGRDEVTCMRKFLSPIKFINFAKFLFACNELPSVEDDSDGYYDRWIRIDFPYKFVNEPELPNEKQIDVNKLKNISTPEEMSGLLNWAIVGLHRLQKNQQFTETEDNKFTRSKWADTASSFSAFLTAEIIVDLKPENFVTINDLNMAYSKFCIEHKLQPEALSERKIRLQKIGTNQIFKTVNFKRYRVYSGIKFRNPDNIQDLDNNNEEELNIGF